MKRARTPSAAIPRKKVKRTKSFKMIPSKSLVFQANTVGAGPERKNIDSNLVGVSGIATPIGLPDWSPTITLLNGVAQGATEVTRVGRKITMTKITMNWNVAMPSAAVGGGSLRFKVVYDKQTNGAAPSILSVFTVDNFYSHNNLANADRYITLFDHITDPLCVQRQSQLSWKAIKEDFIGNRVFRNRWNSRFHRLWFDLSFVSPVWRDHNLISKFLRKYSDQIH